MRRFTPEQIDQLLPQTQCGLCGYGGCMPYAEAMVFENAPVNLCPPGGVDTLKTLGKLFQEDVAAFIPDMEQKAKPKMLAVIREDECIGCTKCIQACPVDAILGAAKQMHAIITDECTGCELCVTPCPVDCIDMVLDETSSNIDKTQADYYRVRFQAHEKRIAKEKALKQSLKTEQSVTKKKSYIQEALERAKAKKLNQAER